MDLSELLGKERSMSEITYKDPTLLSPVTRNDPTLPPAAGAVTDHR